MVRRTRPGISRFRVRCFASPRNDGVCSNSKHAFATPRRDAPGSCIYLPPKEGVGNAGCPLHPRPRVRLVVVESTRVTTLRAKRCRVHCIPPRVRDDRDTPLVWGGMRKVLDVIWGV